MDILTAGGGSLKEHKDTQDAQEAERVEKIRKEEYNFIKRAKGLESEHNHSRALGDSTSH